MDNLRHSLAVIRQCAICRLDRVYARPSHSNLQGIRKLPCHAGRIVNDHVSPARLHLVRSIGVGEVVRRIIGKSVMRTVKHNLQDAVGSIQLCAGQDVRCEAAVHAMECIFAEDDTEAMILVDKTNAGHIGQL